jgi:hypothetical protein
MIGGGDMVEGLRKIGALTALALTVLGAVSCARASRDVLIAPHDGGLTVDFRDPRGLAHVYLALGDHVLVLHASAALGAAEYVRDGATWRRVRGFEWQCRDPQDAAARARFLSANHWIATVVPPGASGARHFEIDAALRARVEALAAVHYVYPGENAPFPRTLADGARDEELLRGSPPETINFAPSTWQRMR